MKGDNPSVECTKCKTILHTTNMKMSANRTYKNINVFKPEAIFLLYTDLYIRQNYPPKIVIEMFSPEII